MFIKLIGNTGKDLIVETKSYSVCRGEFDPNIICIVVDEVRTDSAKQGGTEFVLSGEPQHYASAFIMNDQGKTIDRLTYLSGPKSEPKVA